MDNFESIREKLLKIKAMADNGVEAGERQAAQNRLEKLMSKYGISLEEIVQEETHEYKYRYTSKLEKQLYTQIYSMVLVEAAVSYSVNIGNRSLYFKMTKLQRVEMDYMVDHYKPLLYSELRKVEKAFINGFFVKHRIFEDVESSGEGSSLSPEEIQRIMAMANGMETKPLRKALNQ